MISKHKPPFLRTAKTVTYAYLVILVALIPCITGAVLSYGLRAFILIITSALLFFLFDTVFSRLVGNSSRNDNFSDITSVVSGIVFGLLLPPNTSLMIVVIGALFGSFVIKQLFGGVGNNLFNQAAAARLFVELVFPRYLRGYSQPFSDYLKVDTLFSIKPLPEYMAIDTSKIYFMEVFNGYYNTLIGVGCFTTIVIGMVYLLLRKNTKPYISFCFIASALFFHLVLNYKIFENNDIKANLREIAVFIITSGIVFAATYLFAVYSNVPIGFRGSLISGIAAGFLAAYLYTRTSVAVTTCVPVLTVNLMTPIVEYLLPHGHIKKSYEVEVKE
ncbi:MAG: RnfABCDGE type electron transport complex subunit D [Clostridia bacterium]|nr:RnfABCDGE type electron transport complex subunit D [Clostridia bacterium]